CCRRNLRGLLRRSDSSTGRRLSIITRHLALWAMPRRPFISMILRSIRRSSETSACAMESLLPPVSRPATERMVWGVRDEFDVALAPDHTGRRYLLNDHRRGGRCDWHRAHRGDRARAGARAIRVYRHGVGLLGALHGVGLCTGHFAVHDG